MNDKSSEIESNVPHFETEFIQQFNNFYLEQLKKYDQNKNMANFKKALPWLIGVGLSIGIGLVIHSLLAPSQNKETPSETSPWTTTLDGVFSGGSSLFKEVLGIFFSGGLSLAMPLIKIGSTAFLGAGGLLSIAVFLKKLWKAEENAKKSEHFIRFIHQSRMFDFLRGNASDKEIETIAKRYSDAIVKQYRAAIEQLLSLGEKGDGVSYFSAFWARAIKTIVTNQKSTSFKPEYLIANMSQLLPEEKYKELTKKIIKNSKFFPNSLKRKWTANGLINHAPFIYKSNDNTSSYLITLKGKLTKRVSQKEEASVLEYFKYPFIIVDKELALKKGYKRWEGYHLIIHNNTAYIKKITNVGKNLGPDEKVKEINDTTEMVNSLHNSVEKATKKDFFETAINVLFVLEHTIRNIFESVEISDADKIENATTIKKVIRKLEQKSIEISLPEDVIRVLKTRLNRGIAHCEKEIFFINENNTYLNFYITNLDAFSSHPIDSLKYLTLPKQKKDYQFLGILLTKLVIIYTMYGYFYNSVTTFYTKYISLLENLDLLKNCQQANPQNLRENVNEVVSSLIPQTVSLVASAFSSTFSYFTGEKIETTNNNQETSFITIENLQTLITVMFVILALLNIFNALGFGARQFSLKRSREGVEADNQAAKQELALSTPKSKKKIPIEGPKPDLVSKEVIAEVEAKQKPVEQSVYKVINNYIFFTPSQTASGNSSNNTLSIENKPVPRITEKSTGVKATLKQKKEQFLSTMGFKR